MSRDPVARGKGSRAPLRPSLDDATVSSIRAMLRPGAHPDQITKAYWYLENLVRWYDEPAIATKRATLAARVKTCRRKKARS